MHREGTCSSSLLSVEHKPGRLVESRRVQRLGGVIAHSLVDPAATGPLRVWNPLAQRGRIMGLAMSRSIGDFCLKPVGVISAPSVTHCVLRPGVDRCIVLGTDGLFECLARAEVERLSLVTPASAGAVQLSAAAVSGWQAGCQGPYRDDISCVLLQLWPEDWHGR